MSLRPPCRARTPGHVAAAALTFAVASLLAGSSARASEEVPLKVGKRTSWRGVVSERCRAVEPLARRVAAEERFDLGLVMAIARLESGFKTDATSRVGARGLMQLMPDTARRLSCGDTYDAETNLRCGIDLLRRFLKHYDGHIIYALSAYAAGYKRASRARRAKTLPSNLRYPEKVLAARAQYLRDGCGP
jgi:soluble lytic murein transglycosylase-like protein